MRMRNQATGVKGSGRKMTIEWSSVGASSTDAQRSHHQQKLKERKARKQEKINQDLAPVPKEEPLTAAETWKRIEARREQMKSSRKMKRGGML